MTDEEKDQQIQKLERDLAHSRRETDDHRVQLSRVQDFCDDRHKPLEAEIREALRVNKEKDLELAALKKRLAELERA
jgi:hypothetical protein